MDDAPPHYHREFLKSPQHAALGVLTLGAGFMSGMLLPLIAGATLYTLGWTYLRLLGIEQSLDNFLATEQDENVPGLLKDAQAESAKLQSEVDALKAKGNTGALDARQRYLDSRRERLEVLQKRQQRIEQAQQNLQLVVSEQERLEQQIKLIRTDAVATKNAETLTARIDATVEHLDQTNKWLSELDEFKDLVGDMPATEMRVGYDPTPAPPVLPEAQFARRSIRQK